MAAKAPGFAIVVSRMQRDAINEHTNYAYFRVPESCKRTFETVLDLVCLLSHWEHILLNELELTLNKNKYATNGPYVVDISTADDGHTRGVAMAPLRAIDRLEVDMPTHVMTILTLTWKSRGSKVTALVECKDITSSETFSRVLEFVARHQGDAPVEFVADCCNSLQYKILAKKLAEVGIEAAE
jgi:hypothetical protein